MDRLTAMILRLNCRQRLCLVALLLLPLGAPAGTNTVAPPGRPANWAQPVSRPGLPNFYQVSPTLYRGAQPTAIGMAELKLLGIRTDVNLRSLHDDEDRLKGTGLGYVSLKFYTWHPDEAEVVTFLKTATDPAKQPVFVHCKRGIDRTGMMVALYRIEVQGWTREEAVQEMTQGGFGYDGLFPNLVHYVKTVDIEKLRVKSGLPPRK